MLVPPSSRVLHRHATRAPSNSIFKFLGDVGKAIVNNLSHHAPNSFNGNNNNNNNSNNDNGGKDNGGSKDDKNNQGDSSPTKNGGNSQGGNGQQNGDDGPPGGGNSGKNNGDSGGGPNNSPQPQHGPAATTTINGGTGSPGSPGGSAASQLSNTISSDTSPVQPTTVRSGAESFLTTSGSQHTPAISPSVLPSTVISGDLAHFTTSNSTPATETQASTTTSPSPQAATSGDPNRGIIAGSVLGVLFFLFLLIGAFVFYRRRRRNRVAPSAEFLSHPAAYPFARAGFGNTAGGASTGAGTLGRGFSGTGTGAAGWNQFRALRADSGEGILSEKEPMSRFKDEKPSELRAQQSQPSPRSLPPIEIGEVLYSTPVPGAPQGSSPGTPTTPNGRRIPFGTGTFQFPPRTQEQ